MDYYKIDYSNDRKIIGNVDTPIKGVLKPFNFPIQPYYNFYHGDYFSGNGVFPDLELNYKSKWTDYVYHFTNLKFKIFSKKAWRIISQFELPEIVTLPFNIHKKNDVRLYLAIHFNMEMGDTFIDWNTSTYYLINNKKYKLGLSKDKIIYDKIVSFENNDNYENYLLKMMDIGFHLRPKSLKIKPNFSYDLFFIGIAMSGMYCSENLKNAIQEEKLLGFKFTKIDID